MILRQVIDARTLEFKCWVSPTRFVTQRCRLAGVCTPRGRTTAAAEATEWVEDWLIDHTATHPPALMVSSPVPLPRRSWRPVQVRISAPDGALLNEDIVTSGHGWAKTLGAPDCN